MGGSGLRAVTVVGAHFMKRSRYTVPVPDRIHREATNASSRPPSEPDLNVQFL